MNKLLLIALALYLIAALPMRYIADDYCDALTASDLLGKAHAFYFGWSGRYTYGLAVSLGKVGGIGLVALPTMLIIVAAWYGLCRLLRSVERATFLLISILAATPNLVQSLYWNAGATGYGLALLGTLALVWMIRRD